MCFHWITQDKIINIEQIPGLVTKIIEIVTPYIIVNEKFSI